MTSCSHADTIRAVTPSARGCEECLKIGSPWLHLRLCRACGHVGCCDDSPRRHATAHFHATRHPIIEGYDPPEGWGWCYVDEEVIDLLDQIDAVLVEEIDRLNAEPLERAIDGGTDVLRPAGDAPIFARRGLDIEAGLVAITTRSRIERNASPTTSSFSKGL